MKKTTITIVMAMLCPKKLKAGRPKLKAYLQIALLFFINFNAIAQGSFDKTKINSYKAVANSLPLGEGKGGAPLRVGDKLPETFWQQEHSFYANGQITKQNLSAYKGKLLILDFWATWCGSCIKKFSLSDSLHQSYGERAAVLLINTTSTKDTPAKISNTMAAHGQNLQTVLNDTLITKLFPQAQLPHYVWIENGQVRAITGTEFFTRENVANALQRRSVLHQAIQKRKAKSHEKR